MTEPVNGPAPLRIAGPVAAPVGQGLRVRALDAPPEFALRLASTVDRVEISARPQTDRIQRVVAATVPGRIDFGGESPAPPTHALPMYRHPADKNAAATAVNAGRVLDVTG